MKSMLLALALLVAGLFFLPSHSTDGDKKNRVLINAVSQSLQQNHYLSLQVDDAFSSKMFDLYIERLDYGKRYLLASDLKNFEQYRNQLDNQANAGTFEFLESAIEVYDKRLDQVQVMCRDILSRPFDFNTNEEVELDAEKSNFPADSAAQYDLWRKLLKYQTLTRVADMLETQEKAVEKKDTSVKVKTFAEIEAEARQKVLKAQEDAFRRMEKLKKEDQYNLYYNCFANLYDPHSEYFPPKDKADFDISMSGQFEGIGATLQQRDEYIRVAKIIEGSASWRQGQLKEGDLILKVAQGNAEPVDVVDMRVDDAVQLIRGKKGTEVRLTVKKLDGTIVVIPIVRDVVVIEDTYAKSAIVYDADSTVKMGYLFLPKFYADFNQRNGRHCAVDVMNEVKKLKDEGVDGIAIDLRNNGGGSLQDVVTMMGYFIEKGPVVQVKDRTSDPELLKDNDPTILYTGPLMVMVNSFSASASEILAAAVQDYKRGVVVGSPSTFGKGTVQRFLDFDQYVSNSYNDVKPLGAIKMTIQKFYRVDGSTTQLKGVAPDIVLPDGYSYIDIGEKEQDYPMAWDKITKANYTTWSGAPDISDLQKKSKKRTHADSMFVLAEEYAQLQKKQSENTLVTLNVDKYRKQQADLKKKTTRYNQINNTFTGARVKTLKADLGTLGNDTARIARNNAWHKEIKEDIYINETVNVLKDWLKKQ